MCDELVSSAETKIRKVDSRHTLYLKKELVEDSLFPFRPNENLIIRVEGDKLVIERKRGK